MASSEEVHLVLLLFVPVHLAEFSVDLVAHGEHFDL